MQKITFRVEKYVDILIFLVGKCCGKINIVKRVKFVDFIIWFDGIFIESSKK